MKNIVIVSYGFSAEKITLQPWRYVYEIGRRLQKRGYHASIVTDSPAPDDGVLPGIRVRGGFSLRPFSGRSLERGIAGISPDIILWPIGVKSVFYAPFLRSLGAAVLGYFPGPIPGIADFRAALKRRLPKESFSAALWILARNTGWAGIMGSCCKAFIVMSESNRDALIKMGINGQRLFTVTAGRDSPATPEKNSNTIVKDKGPCAPERKALYMGSPHPARGIDLLLAAFKSAARRGAGVHLTVLSRGEGTRWHKRLREGVARHPERGKITLVEGFLPKEVVLRHIFECDFGVLPFIQAPADRPISFLEFFAAGKPVISTDASGIPELIGNDRGRICGRNNPGELAAALSQMAAMREGEFTQYRDSCLEFIKDYPGWGSSASKFAEILNKI